MRKKHLLAQLYAMSLKNDCELELRSFNARLAQHQNQLQIGTKLVTLFTIYHATSNLCKCMLFTQSL